MTMFIIIYKQYNFYINEKYDIQFSINFFELLFSNLIVRCLIRSLKKIKLLLKIKM